ncbi:MAG TPA: c-type cytochrome [Xanthobacteraceae bacterium]|jgi:cytochrome c
MCTRKPGLALVLLLALAGATSARAETPGLGQPIAEADIAAWNIDVLPDGTGLPPGSGTAKQGAAIYAQKCALCHGENGVNPAPHIVPLVGPSRFDRIDTMKTVPYYKYATTLFDVVRRSMPYPMPKTLTSEEVYALCAYILSLNKIIGEEAVMDAKTLPQVKMPNRDNFIVWDPDKIGYEPVRPSGPAMR